MKTILRYAYNQMRRRQIQSFGLVIGLTLALTACFNEPNFSDTPAIRFLSVDPYNVTTTTGVGAGRRDSVVTNIHFQDGNGDLGEATNDTAYIRSRYGTQTWGNYQIRTFQYVNKQFVEIQLPENNKLFFPRLTREGAKGPIEGELQFSQIYFYGTRYKLIPVKYRIKIRDRAFNESNEIETDTLSVPFPN